MFTLLVFLLVPLLSAEPHDTNLVIVSCITTVDENDPLIIEIHKDWAPLGSQRFLDLVEDSYFTDCSFFRVVTGFLVQFGIASHPGKWYSWQIKGKIQDDPKIQKFVRGSLSFAGSGENSRTTELFIANSNENPFGNPYWEVPIGKVLNMEIVDKIYSGYGDVEPHGTGPSQQRMYKEGNTYLRKDFPNLDYIIGCEITSQPPKEEKEMNLLEDLNIVFQKGSLSDGAKQHLVFVACFCVVLILVSVFVVGRWRLKSSTEKTL